MGVIHKENPLHTYKRKGSDVYQFQIRVPSTLKHLYDGKTHIRFSLKTREASEARKLALVHAAKYTQDFTHLQAEADQSRLNIHNRLQAIPFASVESWVKMNSEHARLSHDLSNESLIIGLDAELDLHYDMVEAVMEQGASASGLFRSAQYSTFLECVPRKDKEGLNTLSATEKARLYIAYVAELNTAKPRLCKHLANPLSGNRPIELEKPVIRHSLMTVFNEFLANKKGESKGGLSVKLEQRYVSTYECLIGLLGADTLIADVTRADIRALRDVLAKCPSNHKKLKDTRHMSVEELYEAANAGLLAHLKPLSITTINQRIETLSSLFNFAIHERYITVNPTEGIRLKKQVADKDSRDPWSAELLGRLLLETVNTKHYWTVRLGLCGMRMNEIVQLRKEDIKQDTSGIWYIDVNTEDNKKVKTLSSIRHVPVPQYLLDAGFLSFVESCSTDTLFDVKASKATGYRSDVYSKAFGYFTKTKNLRAPRVSFHSLRHNFKDMALIAGVPEAAYKQLAGWTEESVSGSYGSGYSLPQLKIHIDSLPWDSLA